jgi:SAM-dependent methyltransferase
MKDLKKYYSGHHLHGDDFSHAEIEAWFKDEAEGYADLGAKNHDNYTYYYHALNKHHGYRFLPEGPIGKVLGFGSAYGDEFMPIISKIEEITILDPSSAFEQNEVNGVPCHYVKPEVSGVLPFPDDHFDLVTSLGVLHHIPNVSFVVSEIQRVLKPGGLFLLREPIRSMGDWRRPRVGLTRRERGISVRFFRALFARQDWKIINRSLCFFPLYKQFKGGEMFLDAKAVKVDQKLCSIFRFCTRYHGPRILYNKYLNRFRPACVFYVLRKP